MSGQRHPDTETLASLRAGLVGGLRGRRLTAHVTRCARCAATSDELAAVSSFLASVPAPSLPDSFEQRISAALAAEAAARAMTASENAGTATSPAGGDPGISGQPAPDRVPADKRPPASRRRRAPALRLRPAMAFAPLVLCLLAGFSYLLTTIGGPSSNSSSSQAASAASPAGAAANAPALRRPAGFVVTASGTNYSLRTLGAQVSVQMSAQYGFAGRQAIASGAGGTASHSTSAGGSASTIPSASAAPASSAAPSRNLTGCVLRLTGGVRPTLVDEATYQGKPVYVIAVPARAWVVGRGCTASNTELITTVALTAAP
jgi:hypothetical protein